MYIFKRYIENKFLLLRNIFIFEFLQLHLKAKFILKVFAQLIIKQSIFNSWDFNC